MVVTSFRSRSGSRFIAYVIGLGLPLGLAPVARGALGLRIGVPFTTRGRAGYPEGCARARATGNGSY